MYNGLGFIKMSMNYYTVLDIARDLQNDKDLLNMINRLNELVERFVENDECDDYEAFNELNSFREQIIEIMEVITAYVDRLRIYEHVLNRVEYRFNDGELDYDYYNTYMTNEIMHYILSDKDNVVINGKISEIVGQLPVRMLKGRFFEHIRDAFTLYHGAGKDSIDDFYYTLSTSAMLSGEAGFDKFPDVYDIYNTLAGADYKNIDKDEYVRLKGALDFAVAIVVAVVYLHFNSSTITFAIFGGSVNIPPVVFGILTVILVWVSINVTNCSDGVDGLSGTLTIITIMTFFVLDSVLKIADSFNYCILLFAVCLLGYLWYNATPSKLLMGDAGSRAMGIFIAICALKSQSPFI